MKYSGKILFLMIFFTSGIIYSQKLSDPLTKKPIETDSLIIETSSANESDEEMKDHLSESYPLISDKWIDEIISTKEVLAQQSSTDASATGFVRVKYLVPKSFLVDSAKILWELNIPEFSSYLYALYQQDTVFIDKWNNVVGKATTRTNPGMFEAYRIRNWPSWKDPEKPESTPTPPGPNNPLGLFVVHYDETSLRYFHGTNKSHLLSSQRRDLSHGCVRNENQNIQKMKEFIIKKVVKSKDLTSWLDSKKTLSYDLSENERFPVKILYKTYTVYRDENGVFIELFKDVYNFANAKNYDKYTDPDYIYLSTKENIFSEYKNRIRDNKLSDEEIMKAIDYVLENKRYYHKYYISDIL